MIAGGEALLVLGAVIVALTALVTARRRVARTERELALHVVRDPLTGLANRSGFNDELSKALSMSAAGTIGVLLIDIDDFRLVNDSLGHTAGDQLLSTMASRLLDAVPPNATIARFGGDEFVVACHDLTDAASAFDVAQQLGTVITAPIEVCDRIVTATASIGVTTNSYVSSAEDLIREADTARYVAKSRGRGRVHQFGEILRQQVSRRFTIEHELRAALRRGQLRLQYQPIVDLSTGRAAGVEALLRWNHPALGDVPPATFIPVAEETELISTIGAFVLEEACLQAALWRDQGRPLRVSVNVSGQQITDTQFPEFVADTLTDSHLPAELLCLELTESVLMSDAMRTIDSLTALKALGASLSVDDFGTGYSSLAYLHHFPVDELKIDRAFVKGLAGRHDQHALLSAMVAMGKALGLRVVAEGVETTAQLHALREFGCDLAQGYLFARPQNARDMSVLLTDAAPSDAKAGARILRPAPRTEPAPGARTGAGRRPV